MPVIIGLATRKWLSPRLVAVAVYVGAVAGFLVAYAPDVSAEGAGQWLLVPALWSVHYVRRIGEVLFVERSSRPKSLLELVAGAAYYTGFGIWIGQEADGGGVALPQLLLGIGLFVAGEAGNARHHLMLRRQAEGHTGHVIPQGGLFRLVSCPHYLFEVVTWIGFAVVLPNAATATFLVVASAIMLIRALARHRRYRSAFDGREGRPLYPRERKALVPFVI